MLVFPILLLSISSLWGQKTQTISLNPEPVQIKDRSFFIYKVIDNRRDKKSIGLVRVGGRNKPAMADFEMDLIPTLQQACHLMIPREKDQIPLVMRVNKLRIYEDIHAKSQTGRVALKAEFMTENTGELLTYGELIIEVEEEHLDCTPTHGNRIVDALEDLFVDFANSDWESRDPEPPVPNDSLPESTFRFDPEANLKPGLYRYFPDMIKNEPDTTTEYLMRRRKTDGMTTHYLIVTPGKEKRIRNLFGFSDGNYICLNASQYKAADYFVKSQWLGSRYIYFEDEVEGDAAAVGYLFGIVGAVGVAAATKTRPIILDTRTGVVTVLFNQDMEALLRPHPDLLKEYRGGKKGKEEVRVIIEKLDAKYK